MTSEDIRALILLKYKETGLWYAKFINDFLIFLMLVTLIVYKLLRQKTNWHIWMQIVMLMVTTIGILIDMIFFYRSIDNGELDLTAEIVGYLSLLLFIVQHWIFAFSYFKIAMNFKLIFSVDSEEIKKKLKRRTRILNVIQYVGLAIFILMDFLTNFIQNKYGIITAEVNVALCQITILVILSFSILRIRKYSKLLVQNKIFANETLMICHLLSFIALTL